MDWIINFFDKCRIVSDEDMQRLWSRVLAGEANAPGAFSRRTVSLLADFEKSDAELFRCLCGYCWIIGKSTPLIYEDEEEIYSRNKINFNTLSHLDSLGLIHFHSITGLRRLNLPKKIIVYYHGLSQELIFPNDSNNELVIGSAILSQAGQELASICGSEPVEGFFDYVYKRWAEQSLVPKERTHTPSMRITQDNDEPKL